MSSDRSCSPDPEAISMILRNNLLSALHSEIDGTARMEVVQPSHLLGVCLNSSSPFGALSWGALRLRSLSITICVSLSTAGFGSQLTSRKTGQGLIPLRGFSCEGTVCSPGEPATCFSWCHNQISPLSSQLFAWQRAPAVQLPILNVFMGVVLQGALQSQTLLSAISCLQLSPVSQQYTTPTSPAFFHPAGVDGAIEAVNSENLGSIKALTGARLQAEDTAVMIIPAVQCPHHFSPMGSFQDPNRDSCLPGPASSSFWLCLLRGLAVLLLQSMAVTKSILEEGWGTAAHTHVVPFFLGRNRRGQ